MDRDRIYFSDAFLNQAYPTLVDPYLDEAAYNQMQAIILSHLQIETGGVTLGYFDFSDDNDYDAIIDNYDSSTAPINETRDFTFIFSHQSYGTYSVTLTDLSVSRYGNLSIESYLILNKEILLDVIDQIMIHFEDYYISDTPRSIISLSVDGYHNGTRFIETIDQSVYKVYYPANLADPLRDFYVFLYIVIAVIFLSIFGIFLYSIVHAVTKNVMVARKRDFAIFRSVGTSQTTLGRLVVLEQVIMNIVAFLITVVIIQILGANISLIRAALTYMEIKDYIILLTAFALFGAWLGIRFNRKVFKQTVIESLTSSKGGE